MDEMTAFERTLAAELQRMAGPGRRIDGTVMARAIATTTMRWRFTQMFSATKIAVAGAIFALIGGVLLVGLPPNQRNLDPAQAASSSPNPSASPLPTTEASPSPTASTLPVSTTAASMLAGLVTDEVGPGILRIVSDNAGHNLDEKHPNHRLDVDQIAITGDGTVWLSTTYSRSDNDGTGAMVWALGRPDDFVSPKDVPDGTLVATSDGSLLVISGSPYESTRVADSVVEFDGTKFVPYHGPAARPLNGGGTLWLLRPDDLPGSADDPSADRSSNVLAAISNGERWSNVGGWAQSAQANGYTCSATDSGVRSVQCTDASGNTKSFLRDKGISGLAAAPDGSIWVAGQFGREGGGLYRISFE